MKHRPESVRGWRPGMPLPRWSRTPRRWSTHPPSRHRARPAGRRGARPVSTRALPRFLTTRRARLAILSLLALALILGGAWLWLRDSSLVAVQQVTVTGESGPDAGPIRAALASAGRTMTTLDVQTSRLYAAVSSFPVVRALRVSTEFPHGMRIRVLEELPVAVVMVDGRGVGVASDGTLLHDLARLPTLPRIKLSIPPGGPRLNEPAALDALAAANAAPRPLLPRITQISTAAAHGVTAQLRAGPEVYLGDASSLAAKWRAVLDVLADPDSGGASYIDVSDPARPAAGVGGAAGAAGASTSAAGVAGTAAAAPAATSGSAASTASPTAVPAAGGG